MIRREFVKIIIPLVAIGPRVFLKQSQPELSFGVIADPQYADQEPTGTRFYRASLDKLSQAVSALNEENLDFVVTLGDMIDKDYLSFSKILPIYSKLKAPHNLVLGNHDFDVNDDHKPRILNRLGLDRGYYSKIIKGWRFIYLDGTEESLFRYPEGSSEWTKSKQVYANLVDKGLPQAKPWNGGIGDIQFSWLREELAKAKSAHEHVIISCHYPLLPTKDPHNLWNSEKVVALFDEYDNIAVYMNGHNHAGNYAVQNGTHYVNFKGMVETKSESAYAIVSCYSDHIEIQGFGLEPDRELN